MSVDYAAGLSHCDDLGVCGLDEVGRIVRKLITGCNVEAANKILTLS